MTTTPIKSRTKDKLPRVGVMAATQHIAASMARELGITRPLALSPQTANMRTRGVSLSALIVDEGVWPLSERMRHDLLPCLSVEKGYILRMQRIDPHLRINLSERPWA